MSTFKNDSSSNQQHPLLEKNLSDITTYKFVGLYSIAETLIKELHFNWDREVLLDSQRLYLVIEVLFGGKKCLFATPFRTNIPKNQKPYKSLRKMSGTGSTRKNCTHGIHIAKTIPVTKKSLTRSRHSKKYQPLIKDGTIQNLISDIIKWVSIFDDNSIKEDFRHDYYSVKLKKLLRAVNK